MTRRSFIGALGACGVLSGCRLFEGLSMDRQPNVRIGVISDIHVQCGCDKASRHGVWWKTSRMFEETLKWYRARGVDVVVIAGDLADQGLVEQLQAVADAWYRVFPDDRHPDGRKVEKVFVTGNHDWNGWGYNKLLSKRFSETAEQNRQKMQSDYAGNWERVFHEPYAPIYLKVVKGYPFIGSHWDGSAGNSVRAYGRLEPFLKAHAATFDPTRPFFYVQHPHPKDTCYGSWAWGHDNGTVTRCLSAFPNAIALSGHSHYTLVDERSIWQGAFTSIGAASLSYTGTPYNDRPGEGYENTRSERNAWRVDARKLMGSYSVGPIVGSNLFGDSCQGMLMDVFDDTVIISRRDFANDAALGEDWVLPLPVAEKKPYAFSCRAKALSAPAFAPEATLSVERTTARTRGGHSGDETEPAADIPACRVAVPPANANSAARVKSFEIVLQQGTNRMEKHVLAEGFHLPSSHSRACAGTTCMIGPVEQGPVTLTVTPIGWFGARGKPLVWSETSS